MPEKAKSNSKVVADNRRARFDYEIGETFEAGLMLTGAGGQVASQRQGDGGRELRFRRPQRRGDPLQRQHPRISAGQPLQSRPKRPRKLLLHAKEIAKLAKGVEREGMTIVPLRIYFNAKGRAKIAIALGRGKKLHDKRETEKARDWSRDKSRLMRERG